MTSFCFFMTNTCCLEAHTLSVTFPLTFGFAFPPFVCVLLTRRCVVLRLVLLRLIIASNFSIFRTQIVSIKF